MRKLSTHGVNLPLDGVACHSTFSPSFRHHGAYPNVLFTKQHRGINLFCGLTGYGFGGKRIAVQNEVRCFCNNGSRQYGLELRSGFKPLH